MQLKSRSAAVAVAATGCLIAVPAVTSGATGSAAASKSVTCSVVADDPHNATLLNSDMRCGSPLGKGRQTGKLTLPVSSGRFTFKGGSFSVRARGAIKGPREATLALTISNGSGRFRGWTGTGTGSGDPTTGKYTYKLRLKRR